MIQGHWQLVAALGQQARGHQLQYRVLRPAGPDGPRQGPEGGTTKRSTRTSRSTRPGPPLRWEDCSTSDRQESHPPSPHSCRRSGLCRGAPPPGASPRRRASVGSVTRTPGARPQPGHGLVRVTEAAAGRRPVDGPGRQEGADGAAVDAMRVVLSSGGHGRSRGHRRGREGRRPDALQRGARSVTAARRTTESRSTRSTGRPPPPWAGAGALAVIAVSERGTMFDPGPCVYMEKLAVGPRAGARSTSP